MNVGELEVRFLRILSEAHLRLHPRWNLLVGPNGSGKTSVLEALWVLGQLHSFRSRRPQDLVQRGAEGFRVSAVLQREGMTRRLSVERRRGATRVMLDGQGVQRSSQLAAAAPMVLLEPDSQRLLTGGPRERRRLLDWTLFHVKQDYLQSWRAYHEALKQRNAALRAGPAAVRPWNPVIAERAAAIDQARRDCVDSLQSALDQSTAQVLPKAVKLAYRPGWPTAMEYQAALEVSLEADRERGFTLYGPHKSELGVLCGDERAAVVYSRGQGKLLAACIMLAKAAFISDRTGNQPVLLLDDLASELDRGSRAAVLALLGATPCQVMLTALDKGDLAVHEGRLFHVEQGRIEERPL